MSGNDLEREVIRMGDVGVAIDMVDNNLAEGKLEQAERAVVILREIFAARNDGLRNCVIFTTPERQELRVVFDPDGTPFFCGPDLAAIAGYEQPRKAVTGGNQGVNRIESVLRKVPWDNGMRRGRCDFTCFSAENAVKLLCRRPAPYAAIRWLEDEVIPKTQEMGEEVARTYPAWNKKPAQQEPTELPQSLKPEPEAFKREPMQAGGGALIERLDNIILECVLLKKELSKAK